MSDLRIGLVGCGQIALSVHLGNLLGIPNSNLVAVADLDAQRRNRASQLAPKAKVFEDYRDLLAWPEVDAVVICLPNALHATVAIAALQAGKHVYLEKPIATSCQEAKPLMAQWQAADLVGMVGFNYRHHPLYQRAKQGLQAGQIGDVVCVRSVFSAAHHGLPPWKQQRSTGGGVLLDLAAHHLDLIPFLLNSAITTVQAALRSIYSDDDTTIVTCQLDSGVWVQSYFSLSTVDEDRVEIYGTQGKLSVDRYRSLNLDLAPPRMDYSRLSRLGRWLRSLPSSPNLLKKLRTPSYEPSYRAALNQFVQAVRHGKPAQPTFADGYRSLAAVEAAEASAKTGQPVVVSPYED